MLSAFILLEITVAALREQKAGGDMKEARRRLRLCCFCCFLLDAQVRDTEDGKTSLVTTGFIQMAILRRKIDDMKKTDLRYVPTDNYTVRGHGRRLLKSNHRMRRRTRSDAGWWGLVRLLQGVNAAPWHLQPI